MVLGFVGCKKDEPAQQQPQPVTTVDDRKPLVEKKVRGGHKAVSLLEQNFYLPFNDREGMSVEFPKNVRKILYSVAISRNPLSVRSSLLTTQLNELIQNKNIENIESIDYSTKVSPLQEGDHWSDFYVMNNADYERFMGGLASQYYTSSSKKDFRNGVVELDNSVYNLLFNNRDNFNLVAFNRTASDQYINVEISAIVRTYFYKNYDGTESELPENSPFIIAELLYEELGRVNTSSKYILKLLENISESDFNLIVNAFGVVPYNKTGRCICDLSYAKMETDLGYDLKQILKIELGEGSNPEPYNSLK